MAGDEVAAIRRVTERLHGLAEAFPDFRYAELTGRAVRDEQFTFAAISSLIGNADCIYQHDAVGARARCVYGSDVDECVALLNQMADEIWLAIRAVMWHFRDPGTDAAEAGFPAVRETGAPFLLIATTLGMATDLPQRVTEEFAKLDVELRLQSHGGTEVHQGRVTVQDGCLVFPGALFVPSHAQADGGDDTRAQYEEVVAAATRGELYAGHSLFPAFKLISAFFGSVLTLEELGRDIADAHERHESDPSARRADLIPPIEQAEMLGWAQPQSNPTLKRLGALREAVRARGMALDAQRVKGLGNKTFVPRQQWVEVVKLYALFSCGSTSVDNAIASISGGVRLMNPTGQPVSYRCDGCGELTRTPAAEPECSGCRKHDRLRPLTSPRQK